MTVSEIVKKLKTNALAAQLGLDPSTVSKWRERGIPGEYWLAIVDFAAARGENEITLDVLAALHSKREPANVEARP